MKTIKPTLILIILLFISCKEDNNKTDIKNDTIETEKSSLQFENIDSTQFPNEIKYQGNIKNAVRWRDKQGENIVITTETGIYKKENIERLNDTSRDAELFAYHYLIKDNKVTPSWKVYDFILDCEVDVFASFIKNSFNITDLDNNGIAEVWLMYKTTCTGDVSPSNMKIIMYEGNKKYAMRGTNKSLIGIDENGKNSYMGGEYKFDEEFNKSKKVFKDFAVNLWNKNILETWGK